jgi:DNA processing protein
MDLGELKFLNALNAIPGVGAATLRALKNHFGSFQAAWNADEGIFNNLPIDSPERAALQTHKHVINPDREMQKVMRNNIWIITDDETGYPLQLKEIPHAPLILYGRGDKQALAAPHLVAVVGTRRPTPYGIEAAEAITGELASAGVAIASGLASGIDAKAHAATLLGKGTTIAVLGAGVDQSSIFPPENRGLAERIVSSGGAVISEYSPGTPAVKEHFPMRNRIISGLSQGTLVVEAREKSGALITARCALEQNREVFALPGSIFSPTSAGTNKLIQEGAKAVTRSRDILEELGIDYEAAGRENQIRSLNEKEALLLNLLAEPLAMDAIKTKTGLSTPTILASLSMLELKKFVRNVGGNTYQKT